METLKREFIWKFRKDRQKYSARQWYKKLGLKLKKLKFKPLDADACVYIQNNLTKIPVKNIGKRQHEYYVIDVKRTENLLIVFTETGEKLVGFIDADWGANTDDRSSFTGYVFKLAGCAVNWSSRKQKTVAM